MILMLNNEFPPIGGGSSTVNYKLFQYWNDPEIKLHLLTCSLPQMTRSAEISDGCAVESLKNCHIKNLHHSTVFELIRYAFLSFIRGRAICRSGKAKAVFAWSTVPSGGVALALSALYSLPIIVRVSGPDIPGFEKRYKYLYPLLRPLLRMVWRRATRVIAKCEFEAARIREEAPTANVQIIPNGTDFNGDILPREFDPTSSPLRILCVARLVERKGIHLLIRAVGMAHRAGHHLSLTIVGTGDIRHKLESVVSEESLQDTVTFAGALDRRDISEAYLKAHVFALTSFCEGMSVATLEAVGAGLPVITTDVGGAREIVEHGKNGFVLDEFSPSAVQESIQKFLDTPQLVKSMSRNSLQLAAKFSWPAVVKSYSLLFRTFEGVC